jgi:hypothetical protein
MMKLVGYLPEGLLNRFDAAAGFFNTRVQPMLGFSNGLTSGLPYTGNKHSHVPESDVPAVEFEERLFPKIIQRVHAENIQGLSSDALLLLKRAGSADIWGPWLDCDKFVPLLAELERSRAQNTDFADQAMPLTVEVFFSEKDAMIGTGAGPKWFDKCWQLEQRGNRIEYSS